MPPRSIVTLAIGEIMAATIHNAGRHISRWDLPLAVQESSPARQAAYCRNIARRYRQAMYGSLAALGLVDVFLLYDVLLGKGHVAGGSFLRSAAVLIPWLAATVAFGISFHQRSRHYTRLATHIKQLVNDGPEA